MTSSRNLAEDGVGADTGIQDLVFSRNNLGTANSLIRYLTGLASFARDDQVEEITVGHDILALESMVVRRAVVLIVHDILAGVQSLW